MITQQLIDQPWCDGMLAPIYSSEQVEREMPGTDAEISGGYHENQKSGSLAVEWLCRSGLAVREKIHSGGHDL